MTPKDWIILGFIAYAVVGFFAVIGLLEANRTPEPKTLFPDLDAKEEWARIRGDTKTIGRVRKERRDRLHAALGRKAA